MSDIYRMTEDGRQTIVGVVSSICHGYDLNQAAALNGLNDEDEVKVLLVMLLAEADIVAPMSAEDDDF